MAKPEPQPKPKPDKKKAEKFVKFYDKRPDKKTKKLLLGYLVGK